MFFFAKKKKDLFHWQNLYWHSRGERDDANETGLKEGEEIRNVDYSAPFAPLHSLKYLYLPHLQQTSVVLHMIGHSCLPPKCRHRKDLWVHQCWNH